jgi:hypothetical protein
MNFKEKTGIVYDIAGIRSRRHVGVADISKAQRQKRS